jgi:hypothetical protein
LALVDHDRYPALSEDFSMDALVEVLTENVGDGGLSLNNLIRVPMPAGGSTAWEIPDPLAVDGKPVMTQEIVCTLAYWKAARVFWIPTEDGSLTGEPPDCSSPDGKTPIRDGMYGPDGSNAHLNPGGKCATCPMSKFGSTLKPGGGKGQACAERRLLFVSQPGELLPIMISAPPTSLDPLQSFMIPLSVRHMMHYSAFEIGLSLKRQERNGTKWATLEPRLIGVLEGARSRVQGGPIPGSPAARAMAFSQGFEKLLGDQAIMDLVTGQARAEENPDDGLGGDFADHGTDGP